MIRLQWFGAIQISASGDGSANSAGPFHPRPDKIPAMARKKSGAALALSMWMSLHVPQYYPRASSPGPVRSESVIVTATKEADAAAPDKAKQNDGFFHHLLEVINPLQHLPIIGTIYRAITGDKMSSAEKLMGDTLYGGMWGAITSVADVAFEGLTGKSFEDTALSLFKSDGRSRVATTKIAPAPIAVNASLPTADVPSLPASSATDAANVSDGLDVAALTSALSAKGVNSDTASRALYAYRRSMSLVGMGQSPVLAGVH